MKKIYLLLIALLLVPTIALAEECSDTDLVELKTKASKTEFKLVPDYVLKIGTNADTGKEYTYQENIFKIVASNLDTDFYYFRKRNNADILEWDSRKLPFKNNKYSTTLDNDFNEIYDDELYIYGNSKCKDQLILKLQITVPKRNNYASMQVCEGISEYYLCQEFLYQDYEVTFDTIKNSSEKYRKGLIDKSGKKKEKKSILEMITNFTSKYFIPLMIILVIASGVIAFFTVKRRRRMKKHFG